ncbi:MAG: hypothetical protein HY699_15800 [Deltaproteobacteria bacterium]|nr:hypothetical protein [Deltaproteobacteria bacterium]
MARVLIVFVTFMTLAGCGPQRHGVVDPSQAASFNSADWTVKSPPRPVDTSNKRDQQ